MGGKSRIDAYPAKQCAKAPYTTFFFHLVPLDTVQVVAVEVETAIENRCTTLLGNFTDWNFSNSENSGIVFGSTFGLCSSTHQQKILPICSLIIKAGQNIV